VLRSQPWAPGSEGHREEDDAAASRSPAVISDVERLHVGGRHVREGWKILDIQPGPGVDFVGTCCDLSRFPSGSIGEVYASHVLEHLGYREELPAALREIHRALRGGGVLRASVPDMELLSKLLIHPELDARQRFGVMRMMFGGQIDAHDFHKVGLTWDFLRELLLEAGFSSVRRVEEHGLFDDASSLRRFGHLVSLNVEAVK
jgi:predicted SAM-dependent methyltransferase